MHNTVIKHLELNIVYSIYEIKNHFELKIFIQNKLKKLLGFNVILPYKQMITPFLD